MRATLRAVADADADSVTTLKDNFVSKTEATAALGIGMTKLDELLLGRTIASIKLGRRRLVSLRSLNAYIEQMLAASGGAH